MKYRFVLYLVIACCALEAAAPVFARDVGKALRGVDAEIESAMRDLHVPGVAVGVVVQGKVVLAKGYGVTEIGKPERVDADTIFAVASMSKSFTTGIMAMLVDAGRLDWDQPVREYLHDFRLYDPVATELVTPRDLVTHRTGVPGYDFLRKSTYLDRAELVRRIRYLPPSRTFRSGYEYNNLMYVAAGQLCAVVGGAPWEELVRRWLFEPLQMNRSSTSVAVSARMANHASPHQLRDGSVQVTDFYDYQRFGVGPNGAVNSTVADFLKYLQMYLSEGRIGERQLVSAGQVQQLLRPVVVDGLDSAYALAWSSRQRHGLRMLEHGGTIDGFNSQMLIVPERNIGIVVLSNLYRSGLPRRVTWRLVDRLLGPPGGGLPPPPSQPRPAVDSLPPQITGTRPSADLSAYTGVWFHPAFGNISVTREGDSLLVAFDAVVLRLDHYHYDTFRLRDATQLASFRFDQAGVVAQLLLPLELSAADLAFRRADSGAAAIARQ